MIEYPPGTPSWVDLSTTDLDGSVRFYTELFGWEAVDAGPPEETGGYKFFTLGGEYVGGVGPAQSPDQPTFWLTYVSVEDAEAAQGKVEAAGGRTLMGPLVVGPAGTMALFSDGADGAAFGVWQPDQHRGAQVVNQVGAWAWPELDTRDPDGATRFYGDVFGWTLEPVATEDSGAMVYGSWKLDGRTIGGLLPMGEQIPAEVPANWVAYFGVEDVEAGAARATELGGRPMVGPTDVPAGRFVVLTDPQGAWFALLQGSYDPAPGG